jgi:hypothetical protein
MLSLENPSMTLESSLPMSSHPPTGVIRELLFFGHDGHQSRRIRQFLSAIKAANIVESAIVAVGPGRATVDAVKHISHNPFDPLHVHILDKVCRTGGFVRVRIRDLSVRRIESFNLLRARANWAFTVPCGTPRICAVSRIERPSTSRN